MILLQSLLLYIQLERSDRRRICECVYKTSGAWKINLTQYETHGSTVGMDNNSKLQERAFAVHLWASQNNLIEDIQQIPFFKKIVWDFTQQHNFERDYIVFTQQDYGGACISIDDLDKFFEGLHTEKERVRLGITYTPAVIREYLISHCLKLYSGNGIPTFCDPACGSGGFLYKAAQKYKAMYGLSYSDIFEKYLFGYDIDEFSIENAKIVAHLTCLASGEKMTNLDLNMRCMNSLVDSFDKEDFDIVCTNPPYVKLQNIPENERSLYKRLYAHIATGSYSLSMLFIDKGMSLLSSNGVLGYITQNNLFTSNAAKSLRSSIQPNLSSVINFGKNRVFKDVGAYTCLLFLTKKENSIFEFSSLKDESQLKRGKIDSSLLDNSSLNPQKWRICQKVHVNNLKKIESLPDTLGKSSVIRVGFATLKDKLFFAREVQEGVVKTLKDQTPIEKSVTLPAIKVASLSSDKDLKDNNLRIIFPYRKVIEKFELIDPEEFERLYPNAWKYLISQKQELLLRDKGKLNQPWYAWGRMQSMSAPGPKLLTKTFSKKPQFILDDSNSLFCNGYAIFPKNLRIEVLARLLNSRVMHYYAKLTSFEIEGNYQCYQKNFIEKFGIPRVSSEGWEKLMALDGDSFEKELALLYGISIDDINQILD